MWTGCLHLILLLSSLSSDNPDEKNERERITGKVSELAVPSETLRTFPADFTDDLGLSA
jgi:hypothetical protein